ncbi:MAG: 30S ribosomal protein S5 [Candidatus Aenigmatarchaeota archaeon]|nr:30S ribosomal protein S5 [Candidatus Aenigmarchaeota archaeon]
MVDEETQGLESIESWIPRTKIGKDVLEGKITSIDEIFERGEKIKEPEIVDKLLKLKTEIIWIGGSPGKGGGIKRTPTRRTARMHRSGRRYKISSLVVVGNEDGYVGVGRSVGTTHQIAIEKAIKKAKLNIIPVLRGCGSWRCRCNELHSIKRKTEGKAGSVRIVLMPAPRGSGLVCSEELKKLFMLAGIKDILTKSFGKTKTRFNHVLAAFDALKKLNASR